MGTKQGLSKVPSPFTPGTPLPSQFYTVNFYLDAASLGCGIPCLEELKGHSETNMASTLFLLPMKTPQPREVRDLPEVPQH